LFVRRVALHGWRSDVRPHVSAASCSAAGAPARAPAPRAGTPVVRARAPAAGDSLSLFGVGFAAVAAVLLLACLLLHGRLHVLVLGHRLRVFLCLCLGWFLRLLLPCSCSWIRCFMGGCTCSCSGTGCGCVSAFVWGGFCGCCYRARARASAASWAVARARHRAPAAGASLTLFGVVFEAVAAVLVLVHKLLHGRLHVLVLGHRLRVLLCLYLGWFLRLSLPCLCSRICCFIGGCTCACSGTGCGCFSVFV